MHRWVASQVDAVSYLDLAALMPQGVDVAEYGEGWELVATRDFKAGELVFRNTSTAVTDPRTTIVMGMRGKYRLADFEEHGIKREGYVEFPGFDAFMNHSCDPNTAQRYLSELDYEVRAARDIRAGDRITCDYNALDHGLVTKLIPTRTFDCRCGSRSCRGKIAS